MRHAALRVLGVLLVPVFALAGTRIPADLQARADALARTAQPSVLAWVRDQSAALAQAAGAVDVRALQARVRSHFGVIPISRHGAGPAGAKSFTVLGDMNGADVEALCFIVLMQAARSAEQDLKEIMDGVKAANAAKAQQRVTEKARVHPTPTPAPGQDRVAVLVAAARTVSGKTTNADLAHVAPR